MPLFPELPIPIHWAAMLLVTLVSPGSAMPQDDHSGAAIAALSGFYLFFLLFLVALYVYVALAMQTIAQKTNTQNPWLAWIPIVNIILLLNVAKKPLWWFIMFFIPIVGIVFAVLAWMSVAEARNKPSWWGILIIVPVVNLIVPGYLAWAD